MVEITKMSSRGQVVVPQKAREESGAGEGTIFAVFGSKDAIVLKKIEIPDKEKLIKDLEKISKEGRKRAEKLGLKEEDVPRLVHKLRGIKE